MPMHEQFVASLLSKFSFRFLNKQIISNTAVNEMDRIRARRRNIIPLNTGYLGLGLWITSSVFYYFIPYGTVLVTDTADIGIRAFIACIYTDTWYCLGLAAVLTYGNADAKMKIYNIFKKTQEI